MVGEKLVELWMLKLGMLLCFAYVLIVSKPLIVKFYVTG